MADPYLGQIIPVGFNFAPRGWALCEGQLLAIAQNNALFSLLGTIYGGDGRTTFGLPDLRGRVGLHTGAGPGLPDYRLGSRSGQEEVTLNITQIPSHSHSGVLKGTETDADATKPTGAALANAREDTYVANVVPDKVMAGNSVVVGNTGGSQPHNNMQPYLAIYWCIALVGVYPSRS